jgi:membrane-bound lytic murein transglycosylase D
MRLPPASPLTVALALVAGLAIGSNPNIQPLTWLGEWRRGEPSPKAPTPKGDDSKASSLEGGRPPAASAELARLRDAETRLFPTSLSGTTTQAGASAVAASGSVQLPPAGAFGDLDEPDISVPKQPEVETYVRFFTENGEGRALLERWLERRARYRPFVTPALEQEHLPHALEAIILAESGYHPRARSPVGAMGLWQLMPETARLYGLTVEQNYDERRDPASASAAAAKHLEMLRERLPSWELVLAAYNAGLDRVEEGFASTGTKDYWTLSRSPGGLPRETVLYVPKVLALSIVLENLDSLGFGRKEAAPASTGPSSTSLLSSSSPSNPSLLPPSFGPSRLFATGSLPTRFASPFVELGEPEDSHAIVVFPPASPSPRRSPEDHDVNLDSADLGPALSVDRVAGFAPETTTAPDALERPYRVEPGDTLLKIASRFNVPLRLVAQRNHLGDRYIVRTGQTLKLPISSGVEPARGSDARVTVYLASRGDTVSKIARQFGVSERELILDNDLKNPSYVRDGQIVRVRIPRARAESYLETGVAGQEQ